MERKTKKDRAERKRQRLRIKGKQHSLADE